MYVHGKVLVGVYGCTVVEMICLPNQPTPFCTSMQRQCMCELVHAMYSSLSFFVVHVLVLLAWYYETIGIQTGSYVLSSCAKHDTMLGV